MEKDNNKLTTKDKVSYGTCIAAFVLGWLLIFLDYFTPNIGDISDSSLYILAQSLLYCASILGVTTYFSSELKTFKSEVRKEISNK